MKRAKVIMIQGTASNAGKSLLAAALCRIFRQDGYRVAPFKSQNMALNSYITREGLEMGRAQAVQAQAAGIEPSVRMNPILLKPSSDTGSQVIVNGEVVGTMSARDYFAKKRSFLPQIMQAYESLAAENDIIVVEGAGSPAEINLKTDDIVNMGLAKLIGAPVLLVGDIDRGGVFASLAGTLLLLDSDERRMVKGLVINKFRGDIEILRPGLEQIAQITGVPVVGTVPCLDVDIDDEDSLSDRFYKRGTPGLLDIAVVRLPRISNFTDFNPLSAADGISLRYVHSTAELGSPDLLILPGTKNTMSDLLWLRQCGLEAAIQKFAAAGGAVLGICGGYQMLGKRLRDPFEVEHGGELAGIGLLPVDTVFARQKTRTQVRGAFGTLDGWFAGLSGVPLEGYEIHMGETDSEVPLLWVETQDGIRKPDGAYSGTVCGSYLHGLFDRAETVSALVSCLCTAKGVDPSLISIPDPVAYREAQFDLLAQGVREHIDLQEIYRILKEGVM